MQALALTLNAQEPYNWLYNSNGQLIADTSYSIDSRIQNCFVDHNTYSSYLMNKIYLMNKLNLLNMNISTGDYPVFICKVVLSKKNFSQYRVVQVIVLTDSLSLQDNLHFMEDITGTELYDICGADDFFIHMPVKFQHVFVETQDSIGVSKEFKDGWFVITITDMGTKTN